MMDWLTEAIRQHGLGVGFVAALIGGLALNLTPCVYPMVPVTLAFFSRQASARPGANQGRAGGGMRRTVLLAVLYVLGLSLCYATLGLFAAKTGQLLGAWLQLPAVLIGVALVMVGLALGMFGVYELRPPQALARRLGEASTGLWGAFGMGLVVGIVAAPCIGPFILGLLLFISQQANAAEGFLLLFALGLGMGSPYLVLGLAAHRVSQLPKAGPWLLWSKKALGFVLVGLALYFLKPLLAPRVLGVAVLGLLIGAGLYLGWFERTPSRGLAFVWIRRITGTMLIGAAMLIAWPRPAPGPRVAWVPYTESALEQAQRAQQPIIIDVYADWCLPCVEMDHVTFRRPEVVAALASVTTLRVDATRTVSPDAERLFDQYDIYGAPTILFFGRDGKERTDLRALGFLESEELLRHLDQIRGG